MEDELPKLIKLDVKSEFQIPRVPNFIRNSLDDGLPIENISEEGLRQIGAAWTEMLIMKARQRRAND